MMSSSSSSSSSFSMVDYEIYPELKDLYLPICFSLAFPFVRFLLDLLLFRRLATWLIEPNYAYYVTKSSKCINETKIWKLMESMWKLTFYLSAELFVYYMISKEPWFGTMNALYTGWPEQSLKLSLKLYYHCQCGFYLYSIVALLFWETRRKDFTVMMSHHIITVALTGCSYVLGFFRVGSIILALHDASDVFLELAKSFKYCGIDIGASISFGFFVISWFLLRLIYFPFWIIKSTSYGTAKHFKTLNHQPHYTFIFYVFNTLLITLLGFHVYWWRLICRMVLRQLSNNGQVSDDVRSDSEGED